MQASAAHVLLQLYRFVLGKLRPNSGLTLAAFNPVANALFARIPDRQVATTCGLRIPVSVNDYHGRILWLFGSNDFKVERICRLLSRPGDVFLDIGANHGSIGLAVLESIGREGEVHFFEPQPELGSAIAQALGEEGSGRGHLHAIALSDGDGVLEMSLADNHTGLATIVTPQSSGAFSRKIEVQAVEAGPYLGKLLRGLSFGVKIDIEGAEPIVLRPLLRLPRLRFVQFEGANNIEVLHELFAAAGFDVFGLKRTVLLPEVGYCASLEAWTAYHDFLALPQAAAVPRSSMSFSAVARHLRDWNPAPI